MEHNELLNKYISGDLSMDSYIDEFKVLHFKNKVNKTKSLLNDSDPQFAKLINNLIPEIESLTDFRFSGIDKASDKYDIEDNKDIYYVKFNYKGSSDQLNFGISNGTGGTGTKNGSQYFFSSGFDKISILIQEPSCHYLGGTLPLDTDIKRLLEILIPIQYESRYALPIFSEKYGTISNEDLVDLIYEYSKYY